MDYNVFITADIFMTGITRECLFSVAAWDLEIVYRAEVLGKGHYLCDLYQCWMGIPCGQKGESLIRCTLEKGVCLGKVTSPSLFPLINVCLLKVVFVLSSMRLKKTSFTDFTATGL